MKELIFLPGVIMVFIGGIILGYVNATKTIAKECEKLNAFYVQEVVYDCKKRNE